MPSGASAASWFVRRAGLARFVIAALVFGLALSALVGAHPRASVAALGATVGLLVGWLAFRRLGSARSSLSVVGIVLVLAVGLASGYLLGSVQRASVDRNPLATSVGRTVQVRLVVTGQVKQSGSWQSAAAEIVACKAPGVVGQHVLFEVKTAGTSTGASGVAGTAGTDAVDLGSAGLQQGQIVITAAEVQLPQGETSTGFNQQRYLRNQGIAVILSSDAAGAKVVGQRGGISGMFDRLRASAKDHLSRGPDSKLGEVLQGIVMGDTVGIDAGWNDAFRRAGTAHMLSVSGLHVSALAAIVIGLAGLMRVPRRTGLVLAAATCCLMIPFVGASPPVVRSVIMINVMIAGKLFGRRRDQWQVLGIAAAIVLALNPYSLFDAGFQLSFAAFVGMMLLCEPLGRAFKFLPRGIAENLAVSASASLGTAPVALAVFGRTSVVSVLANLVVVPTLSLVTGLGMLSIFAGFLSHGLSAVLDWAVSPVIAWIVQASRFFAAAPVLESGQIWRLLLACSAALLVAPVGWAIAGGILPAVLTRRLPGLRVTARWIYGHRPRLRSARVALSTAMLVVVFAAGWLIYPVLSGGAYQAVAAFSGGWPDRLEVRILDVGQGNSILIRTPDHHAVLIDGGPEGCGLKNQLRLLGVNSLDALIISHPHADHFAGLLECVGYLKVRTIIDEVQLVNGSGQGGRAAASGAASAGQEACNYISLRMELAKRGCSHLLVRSGGSASVGALHLTFYPPDKPLVMDSAGISGGKSGASVNPWVSPTRAPSGDELNGDSVVVLAEWEGRRFLLPGDAESDVLAKYKLNMCVDVLVVSHHGSRGAVSEELLGELKPKLAAISVGKGNSFGHPDKTTIATLQSAGIKIARTDQVGWIALRVDGGGLSYTTSRSPG